MESTTATTLDTATAERLATTVAALAGVDHALVCATDGEAVGACGTDDPQREAALATFIAARAEALVSDGDLRGIGRLLVGSKLERAILGGGPVECVVVAGHTALAFLTLAPGASAGAVANAVQPLFRRDSLR